MSPSTRPAFFLRRASEVAVLLCVFCVSSLAAAAPLPPSTGSLPPSTFQGGDGNQTDSASLTDWQGLAAANRVNHSPDPNAQDTAFVGGSSEDQPVLWDLTTEPGGVNPAKSNILDAWEVSDPLGGDVFVYLAFARESAQLPARARAATTYLTFELNHDARLWNNGRADIPCRTTGDVLVSYQATGNDVSVILQRWVTNTWDDASGCARTGHLEDYAAFTPNVDAQGAVNDPDIATYLPGFYNGTIPSERFGEASLNLSRLMTAGFNKPCFSFGSIWMHSRSSLSESANMQDYLGPRPLAVRTCSASGTKFHDANANGRRDAGEPGLPRWMIWADYDDNGVRDGQRAVRAHG